MNKYILSSLLALSLVITAVVSTPVLVSQAKSSKSVLSFSLFEGISNDQFEALGDKEKMDHLRTELNKKNSLLRSLERNLQKNKRFEEVEDILNDFAIEVIKENLESQISNYIDKQGKEVEHSEIIDLLPEVPQEIEKDDSSAEMTFESLGDYVEGKVSGFVFDKTNITDANIFYKVTHDKNVFAVLNQSLHYKNNIELLSKKWKKDNLDISYSDLIDSEDEFEADKNIKDYLVCINVSTNLCGDMEGRVILENNILEYVEIKKDEKIREEFAKEFEEAKERFPNRIGKLWVTSYNPLCEQTKGGVMGMDGACYGTESIPCAIGSNKGKTSGLCGNPYIAATGHNMKDMLNEGKRPIAVTQELGFLKGKDVYLKCYSKRTGEEIFDHRCNGYFTVYDTKHERFTNSVDLFIEDKADNIGGVDVEIYYE